MKKEYSILLDLLRLLASMLVFIHHSEQILHVPMVSPFASFGHDAVIFFFILSGFVIAFVANTKEKDINSYAIARLARVFSVSIPSLVLVFVLLALGNVFLGNNYEFNSIQTYRTILESLFFLNFSSIGSGGVPTNGPYWSICYEVFYYLIFGAAFYLQGLLKFLLVSAFIVLAGVKIIVLLPIWMSGYYLYKQHGRIAENVLLGSLLLLVSMSIYFYIRANNLDDHTFKYVVTILFSSADEANTYLQWSKRFVSDYYITILFMLAMSSLFMLRKIYSKFLMVHEIKIRWLASFSFSIYLFHYPILKFLSHININNYIIMIISLLTAMFLGGYTEHKKHLFRNVINKLGNIA